MSENLAQEKNTNEKLNLSIQKWIFVIALMIGAGLLVFTFKNQLDSQQRQIALLEKNIKDTQSNSNTTLKSNQALTEIYLKLSALENAIDALSTPVSPAEEKKIIPSSGWGKMLAPIIVIRERDDQQGEFSTPYLYQNIQVLLNQAMWAVLNKNQSIYQDSLMRASHFIKKYLKSNNKNDLLAEIDRLKEINIDVASVATIIESDYFLKSPMQGNHT